MRIDSSRSDRRMQTGAGCRRSDGPGDAGGRRRGSPAPDEPGEVAAHGAARRCRAIELDRHIGERLRFVRRLSALSQRQVADDVGMSFQQLQKYESGTNRVSAALLAAFSGLFRLPMDWFVGPFSPCARSDERTGGADYAAVLNCLHRELSAGDDLAVDRALQRICRAAGINGGSRRSRLSRLWRAMQESTPERNAALVQVAKRLPPAPRAIEAQMPRPQEAARVPVTAGRGAGCRQAAAVAG